MKRRKAVALLVALAVTSSFLPMINVHAEDTAKINVRIDTSADNVKISPYIYGANYDFDGNEGTIPQVATGSRLSGNRLTGYNWENNASNAGSDWKHTSDNYLNMNKPYNTQNIPGKVVTDYQDEILNNGSNYSIVTLPMAGYVAKDKNGIVSEAETAASARWDQVKVRKGSNFSETPDLTDNYVYMDEFVDKLISKYGKSYTNTGIKGYSLDNEPGLWANTHPRIHKDKVTCAELISKSTEYSKMVKDMDSSAEIFGPVLYGMGSYLDLNSAPDWNNVKGNYKWFSDYYLDNMKKASEKEGKRLLDVFDIHYYSEATGGGIRVTESNDTNVDCNKARIQSARTLWDPTYNEDSWIGKWQSSNLPIIPKMKTSIDTYYPGTKLGITEYNFGGNNHISGGIAQADVFGVFANQNVYFAALWPFSGKSDYTQAAFNLYRNYDGKKSTYGDIKVKAEISDVENSSVYSALDSKDASKLHVIIINKNYDKPMTMNFNIAGNKIYGSGKVWAFDESSAQITEKAPITNITDNKFEYTVPKLTVCHIILDLKQNADPSTFVTGDVNDDNTVDIRDYTALQKYITGEAININKENADINKDTRINTADLLALKKIILGV
ncbi:endoglucanase [Clostridium gelidum]|uniref:Endoglucanase n=1 Tax=Clostridium gelidum TaxID=704125 RepID=A0ABM7TGV2_9CLOT|nr:glycoside hydrolase family 44 protein [Clostridium gelidum]BCZ47858.1 endoglucanase [Clostridium gelidum]